MRAQALSFLSAGITRLRNKGGARGDVLFDLLNGYVNKAGEAQQRPGTVIDTVLPAGTMGLVAHQDMQHVFAPAPVVMTDPDYVCNILRHPTDPEALLVAVPFATSFMQVLYVVADFDDGSTFHYWLREFDAWVADSAYSANGLVQPTTENGYLYRAERISTPGTVWAPDVSRAVADVVEPTVYNGFEYEVVAVFGPDPKSGATEPTWPTIEDAQVTEITDVEIDETPPDRPGLPPPDDGGGGRGTEPYYVFGSREQLP
jgi:hypothetical protein